MYQSLDGAVQAAVLLEEVVLRLGVLAADALIGLHVQERLQTRLIRDQIRLTEDGHGGVGHVQHHGQGHEHSAVELHQVQTEGRVDQTHGAERHIHRAQVLEDAREDIEVHVELELARTVDEEVVAGDGVLLELRVEPVDFAEEKLEAEDESAVGPEAELLHDVLESDEVADVDVGGVGQVLGGGVEVDGDDVALEGLGHGLDGVAVG